ncbi:MAG: universal stress protein, partial [Nitrospirota bacterium]|nr:universal stress protein [Nitrospirota bacterium]
EGSSHALKYAIEMSKRYGAKLYILHVVYDIAKVSSWSIPHQSVDKMYMEIEEGAKKELDGYALDELSGLKDIERIVHKGVPYEEIVKFANENKIDLIVIGTLSRKGIEKMLFGSTAAQVVRYAPCPVLTVRIPAYKG